MQELLSHFTDCSLLLLQEAILFISSVFFLDSFVTSRKERPFLSHESV
jgi:hypothetical protein